MALKKKIAVAIAGVVATSATTGLIAIGASSEEDFDEQNETVEVEAEDEVSEKENKNTDSNIVKHIVVDGTKNIKKEDVLKLIKNTKVDEPYSKDKVKADLDTIIKSGIVQNAKAKTVQSNGELYIVFEIDELSEIKVVTLKGNTLVNTEVLKEKMLTKTGSDFKKENVVKDIEMIRDEYRNAGYIAVVSNVNINNGEVVFEINEAKVDNIEYVGNTKTKAWVLDKIISGVLSKGDFLTVEALQKIHNKLMATGYFESVNISANEGSTRDKIILDVIVKEAKTGEWYLGGGYSDQYKAQVLGGIKENNINGEAKSVEFNVGIGNGKNTFGLSYTDPYFNKTDTEFHVDVFRSKKDVNLTDSKFEETRTGGTIGFVKPISKGKTTKFFTNFTVDKIDTEYISGKKVDGTTENTLTLGIMDDTRDDAVDPHEGTLVTAGVTTSQTFLGSSDSFTKFFGEVKNYTKLSAKDVLASRLAVAYSPDDLKTVSQFSIGGAESVRGLDEDAQRGNKSVLASLEWRHDMSKTVQSVIFVDAGKAWNDAIDNSMKVAAGVGVRIKTGMGMLRLDIAKAAGESIKYMFGIGQSF